MNKVKNSIGWADFSWNPVTGCKRGCSYCYAERIHNRFHPDVPFSSIVYHGDRMDAPFKVKKPAIIFVGSMSDIEYWPRSVTLYILDVCSRCPRHTFMFLSKSCSSYDDYDWPENTMQGLTLDCSGSYEQQKMKLDNMILNPRSFLSIEPLLGKLRCTVSGFEEVIVGAMTGPGAISPKPEWIDSVVSNATENAIFWKDNIKKYLEG